ncbi:YadA-like family protein [Aquabacter sp. L1I39]|uniref:YadA-like family protein n=1 Tax=Aquabacter sp. L1I39 TaxID=2820278 RepID=UPI001ADB4FC0|nr:YadA-like family protein [Aquabacter sp. L1I39]QTL05710.1 YadA-like family protein [Aquabacter sp. L1I39]
MGATSLAHAGGYVIGGTSGTGTDTGLSNMCLTPNDPTSSSATWSCQSNSASGGLVWVSGLVGTSLTVQGADLAPFIGSQSVAIGTQATSATGASAVAIGAGATANVANGVAMGAGASVGAAGGVALGSGSVANTAAGIAGYTPDNATPGSSTALAATKSTLASASIGNAATGQFRQISGVAAGTADSDAVNVAQLKALNSAVTTLRDVAVTYDSTSKDAITLGGASGTSLTNVKSGALSSTSSDAVNGAQLFATNQNVAGLQTNALQWSSTLGAYDAGYGGTAQKISNVAAGTAATDAANLGQVNAVSASLSDLSDRAVVYDGAVGSSKDTVTFGGASGTTLTNVRAGTLSSASSDAVNGSQLFATNENVALLQANALQWSSSLGAYDASRSGAPQKISNVAAGTAASDAVNLAQLNSLASGVNSLSDRAVLYDGASGDPKQTITLAGTGGTLLTNVQAGAVSASSTDALNGSQLYAVSASIANIFGGGASVAANGTILAPSYLINNAAYNSVGDAFGAVDTQLSTLKGSIANLNADTGSAYVQINSAGPGAQATGAESIAIGSAAQAVAANATAIGQGAVANNAGDVALGAGSSTGAAVQTSSMVVNGTTYAVAGLATSTVSVGAAGAERTITNVAAGQVNASSTDAVNGSQLYATNQALSAAMGSVNTLNQNAVRYDTDSGDQKLNSITLAGGDPNAPVVIRNVATGVAATDAVNVAQMDAGLSQALASATSYTDTRTSAAISTANTYTDTKSRQTLAQANAYTDQKFAMLNSSLEGVRSQANQAAAVGLAAGSLRYDDRPGKLSAAAGAGTWGGEAAFAMGVGYTTQDQRVRMNLSGSTAGGDWGFGGGLSLTLN